jgi:nucleoid-associated protein YgaU
MPPRPRPTGAHPVAAIDQAGAHPVAAVALAGSSLVASAGVGSLFLGTARDAWIAIAAAGPAGPADGILLVVGLGGALLSLWLGLGLSLSALSALPGALGQASSLLAARLAPAAARKVVAFVLGTTLTAALVPGTALAQTGSTAPRPALVTAAQLAFGGLADAAPNASFRLVSDGAAPLDAAPAPSWSPDRPASPHRPASGEKPASPVVGVTVHRGDTLWSIAAHHLGPAASSADIDTEWHRWFAANRKVIGDDANLIAPGQTLSPPPSPWRSS